MKKLLPVLLLFLWSINAMAQHGITNLKEVEDLKNRQLILVFFEPGKGEDPSNAKQVNERLLKVFADNWAFTSQPQVKTAAEIEIIKKAKDKKYAFVGFKHMLSDVTQTRSSTNHTGSSPRTTNTTIHKSLEIPVLIMELPEKGQYIYSFTLPNEYPSEAHLTTAVGHCQNYFMSWISNKQESTLGSESRTNGGLLTDKILLVDKANVADKVSEEDIKKNYSLPFQIVSTETIEKAILSKDPKYAFVVMVKPPAFHEVFYHYVFDSEKSRFIGYTFSKEDKIEAKHFKYYFKFSQKKPKS